jgi:hypothetical protein
MSGIARSALPPANQSFTSVWSRCRSEKVGEKFDARKSFQGTAKMAEDMLAAQQAFDERRAKPLAAPTKKEDDDMEKIIRDKIDASNLTFYRTSDGMHRYPPLSLPQRPRPVPC